MIKNELLNNNDNYEITIYPFQINDGIGFPKKNNIHKLLTKKINSYVATEYQYKNIKLMIANDCKNVYKYIPIKAYLRQNISIQLNIKTDLDIEAFPNTTNYLSIDELNVDVYAYNSIKIYNFHNNNTNYYKISFSNNDLNIINKLISECISL